MRSAMVKKVTCAFLVALFGSTASPLCSPRTGIAAPPTISRDSKERLPRKDNDDAPKSVRGVNASISIDKREYRAGDPMEVTIKVTCTEDRQRMFNVAFDGFTDLPGDLLIRNNRGEVVNILFGPNLGSWHKPTEADWITVPPGVFVGTTLTVHPTELRSIASKRLAKEIGEGEYTIQLVLDKLLEKDAVITTKRIPFRISGGN